MLELSVYMASSVFLCFESRKSNSDLLIMIAHHIITAVLIITGYGMRHFNFGLIVANIHDCTDIFLESSKVLNYIVGEPWSLFTFIIFAIGFFICRVIIYPIYLIFPIITGNIYHLIPQLEGVNTSEYFSTKIRIYWILVLGFLWVLDMKWMKMIFRMILDILRL